MAWLLWNYVIFSIALPKQVPCGSVLNMEFRELGNKKWKYKTLVSPFRPQQIVEQQLFPTHFVCCLFWLSLTYKTHQLHMFGSLYVSVFFALVTLSISVSRHSNSDFVTVLFLLTKFAEFLWLFERKNPYRWSWNKDLDCGVYRKKSMNITFNVNQPVYICQLMNMIYI